MRPKSRSTRLLLRLAITVAVGAALVAKLDVRNTLTMLGRIGAEAFIVSIVVVALSSLLAARRWQLVLRCHGVALSFSILTRLYFVGNFFNQILPSSVGGDAVRIWYLNRHGVAVAVAARSVIVDRLLGLAGMVGFVALGLPVMLTRSGDTGLRSVLIGIIAVTAAIACALALVPRLRPSRGLPRPVHFLHGLAGDFRALLRTGALLPCIVLTFATGFSPIVAGAALGYSLAIPLGLLAYAVIIPAALVVSLVPISIAGWGVREAAMVVCMAAYGVSPETAVALSIAFGIASTVAGLPGGLIWFLGLKQSTAGEPKPRQ